MPVLVALLLSLPTGPASTPAAFQTMPADTLEAIYRGGVPFQEFLGSAEARREAWESTWAEASVEDAMLRRVAGAGEGWRLLAVAEDWCSDSVSSMPYIARLVEKMQGLEMRVVTSETGQVVTERYRSPDGRATTPTVVLLDPSGAEVGCWVEQPAALQAWWLAPPAPGETSQMRTGRKMTWYAEDGGRETIREIVEMLEGAAAGRRVCPGG